MGLSHVSSRERTARCRRGCNAVTRSKLGKRPHFIRFTCGLPKCRAGWIVAPRPCFLRAATPCHTSVEGPQKDLQPIRTAVASPNHGEVNGSHRDDKSAPALPSPHERDGTERRKMSRGVLGSAAEVRQTPLIHRPQQEDVRSAVPTQCRSLQPNPYPPTPPGGAAYCKGRVRLPECW
ncbi:hypothetical protein P4O66_008402 [Electrophorus voltai]|uniref:Uncharacterized protein n=1 Tax=Electrophorus voltai TaxID=2609070 RepID=A0AAD8ZDE7_9TELE|nr:hypothetical protein P4O66_008402 [Electrophorus voltai]